MATGGYVLNDNNYQELAGISPVDQTLDIPTTGASFTYTETSVTNVVSTIDPSITNLGYKSCYDNGHAAAGKLITTALFPGFLQNGMTQFPDAMLRRMSNYVDPITGRSPFVLALRTRGRGGLGYVDYARDTYDVLNIVDSAVSAAGSNVYGYGTTGGASIICIGYSTGALDALNFAARCPDRCLGVVVYYPNYDIGLDPSDSYYPLVGSGTRAQIATSVQPGGDIRLVPGAASIDQYLARNASDAIARIMSIPNGPNVWLLGDIDDPEPLPTRQRLKNILQSTASANGKAHIHLTQAGDSNRILHSDGVNGAPEIYAERYYFPHLLANASEWSMPKQSPAGNLRLLGWMKTKSFEIWTGPNTAPITTASAGGRDHASEFSYNDSTQQYKIFPVTSSDGYVQLLRDSENINDTFTALTEKVVDLNISKVIASVADIGVQYSWRADQGVTDSSGVTSWTENLGGILQFTASTNKPAYTTDGDGKALIRFDAASSQKLLLNSLLVDPTQDYTIFLVTNKTNSTSGYPFELSHHGTSARAGIGYNSGVTEGHVFNDAGAWAIANTNGIGGQVWSQNAKHVICFMRKSSVQYMSIDGSYWSYSPYTSLTFTTTGTNTTSLGCGWANGGGAYWQFYTGDIYELDAKGSATGAAEIFSYNGLMRSRWTF